MLWDLHEFGYRAAVPWPGIDVDYPDWHASRYRLEHWLGQHVGPRYRDWAWDLSPDTQLVAVAFRWDRDRLLFVLTWR